MRLRRSVVRGPGLRRVRRGRGFSYHHADDTSVTDAATLQRINDLVIPPAWKNVWICPYPNGHIQAVGTDAAGRRQYLYHQKWQEDRAEEKFDRVLEMSAALPDMRRRIAADLAGRGLERDRVLALALHLLDLGYFRAGGEQYAEENNSFGIATLLCEHVTLQREAVEFDYPAKSGVRRTLIIDDPEVVRSVRALLRRPDRTDRLLVCRNSSGWIDIHADDLNARFKELVGEEYTVKDLRTWHGTVLGGGCIRRRGPAGQQDRHQARGIGGDERGRRGAGQHPCGGAVVLRRSSGGARLRARVDHRAGAAPGRADQAPRRTSSHSGEEHGAVDPQGRQGLAGHDGEPIVSQPLSDNDDAMTLAA